MAKSKKPKNDLVVSKLNYSTMKVIADFMDSQENVTSLLLSRTTGFTSFHIGFLLILMAKSGVIKKSDSRNPTQQFVYTKVNSLPKTDEKKIRMSVVADFTDFKSIQKFTEIPEEGLQKKLDAMVKARDLNVFVESHSGKPLYALVEPLIFVYPVAIPKHFISTTTVNDGRIKEVVKHSPQRKLNL